VAIAAPNFSRYQSKARQSEAKIALAAIYGSEKAFYSEYAAYIGSMDAIGYSPEGARRFYTVGWSAAQGANPTGYNGGNGNSQWTNVNNSFGSCSGTVTATAAGLAGDAQTFIAGAVGCVRQSATLDAWSINELKVLANNQIGL